ncbi:YhdB-like protein [Pelagirhabdus alkalitolerans]|uniref:YhdB-like protein n=1 Tax=Pelagirhabdus alkalitolerans TaxID=1612202 RepID=A0A1G6N620_9BACI|nr:YhdB family protein [Pelagirhabdus alkalitolerans]SDC63302.1 YhdB-like protein [Pelagirhabdus alkalitolerans]
MKDTCYDQALHDVLHQKWDDLFVLMVRTEDDILSKKIKDFFHAFTFERNKKNVINKHEALLDYLYHAQKHELTAVH